MTACPQCKALNEEVAFLRNLADRLLKLANVSAMQAVRPEAYADKSTFDPQEYYGTSGSDEVWDYNEFGQKVLVKRSEVKL